ncbi:MAG: transcriptional repressor [Pseudomonadota bacterium]
MYQHRPPISSTSCDQSTEGALKLAERLCEERGERMTPHRRQTLIILLEAERPLGAYDVLERLTRSGIAGQPPVAYRALDFLMEQGFVHKLRETKTFLACRYPEERHGAGFLICRECGSVDEVCVEAKRGAFGRAARDVGFTIERTVLEAEGVCGQCSKTDA